MQKFLVVVECITENQGKFLMIKRPPGVHAAGLLAFPGGKVDHQDGNDDNNILLTAIKREVKEEVGLILIDPIEFVTSSYFVDSHQSPVLDVIFHCKLEKTVPNITASKREVPEYFWLTLEEIKIHPQTPVWVEKYFDCLYPHPPFGHPLP